MNKPIRKTAGKTYWAVLVEHEVGKKPRGRILSAVRTKKPQKAIRHNVPNVETHVNWFETRKEAQAFLEEALQEAMA
ncbi:hypothetical protein AGMMS49944_16260 [Spirochaetia bacterium]|nr:hypothetical protein AGMMS49944_16260 [Spirochaetia bacterium]